MVQFAGLSTAAMEHYQSQIDLIYKTGARVPAVIQAEEVLIDSSERYRVTLKYAERVVSDESDIGFFDALRKLRLFLEQDECLPWCFGASEDVYPSPMQESMGPAILAYRTQLGQQASSEDIVNIFDADASVKPATVEQQRLFHQKWLQSLRHC